jgi:tetratricopeptide (TPR) repeat protein
VPDDDVRLTLDSRAGVAVPALFDITVRNSGAAAAGVEGLDQITDEDTRRIFVQKVISSMLGDVRMSEYEVTFDEETGIATYNAKGLVTTPWTQDRGVYRLSAPAQAAGDFSIDANRSRAAWRDIPLRINYPLYSRSEVEVLLPDEADAFTLRNGDPIDTMIAGVHLTSTTRLDGGKLTIVQSNRSTRPEIAADEIADARRQAARHERALPLLIAPESAMRAWEYGKDRSRLAAMDEIYATLVAEADADDPSALLNRASFRRGTLDYEGALADYGAALEIEADEQTYFARADLRGVMGDLEGALEDIETAEDLAPTGWSYPQRVQWLGRLGRADEAVALAEEYADYVDERHLADQVMAEALGWAGQTEEGLALLEDTLAARPGDGGTLNAMCWLAGTRDAVDAAMMDQCEQAVERSSYSPGSLDSRALAHYRMGNYAAALNDADAALRDHRELPQTRYLRGLILIAQGDRAAGQASIAEAVAMRPGVEAEYAQWGLSPK